MSTLTLLSWHCSSMPKNKRDVSDYNKQNVQCVKYTVLPKITVLHTVTQWKSSSLIHMNVQMISRGQLVCASRSLPGQTSFTCLMDLVVFHCKFSVCTRFQSLKVCIDTSCQFVGVSMSEGIYWHKFSVCTVFQNLKVGIDTCCGKMYYRYCSSNVKTWRYLRCHWLKVFTMDGNVALSYLYSSAAW